jgi:methionine-S-sulfoxide reductase
MLSICLYILVGCSNSNGVHTSSSSQPTSQPMHTSPSSLPTAVLKKTSSTHTTTQKEQDSFPHFPKSIDIQSWLTLHPTHKIAVFAGGCFWCVEAPFDKHPAVFAALSGYAGGRKKNPTYREVAAGETLHREAVIVFYDASKVTYEALLDLFWHQINPTQADGQFADRGTQYQTAIYYNNVEQKSLAELSLKALQNSKKFTDPIATEIKEAQVFWPAEDYHQNYHQTNRTHYLRYKSGSGRAGYIKRVWGNK